MHTDSQILLVDDSSATRKIVRGLLKKLGFGNIDEATDGEDALKKIGEKRYSLVITDWNMQPMNGQTLLERVRASEKSHRLPFIMMTAETAIEKVVNAGRARVNGFINKPFDAEVLKTKISQIGQKC